MKESRFCVYVHKFPNGKKYFGITSKQPHKRWQNGTGYSKNGQSAMYHAIKKYGWENIEHEILFENLTENEAKIKEMELIKKYNTYIHSENSNGYNMTLGGEGSLGHKSTKKVKEVNRERLLGKRGDLCCNSHSVICDGIRYESIAQFCEVNNLGKGMVECWLSGRHCMPKCWLEKNLRKEHGEDKRRKTPQRKNWQNGIEYDGVVYKSQAELAKFLKVSTASVCGWMNGKTKIPEDIYKKGIKFINKPNTGLKTYSNHRKTSIEYDGVIYETQLELSKFLGVSKSTVSLWVTGKAKIPQEHIEKGFKVLN